MCGIAGFNWNDKDLIKKMTDSIQHRGPDGEGFFTVEKISLGHRRLSIIDLSEKASQPMMYKDLAIVFNGEIYNFQEIKTHLISLGHSFISDSDTEVILHAYEEWGTECVNEFNGMWSFCIFDKNKNILFLSRDRFGEKPLYYFYDSHKFIFASEIKAIRQHQLSLKIDHSAINHFFYQKYIGGEKTIFENIFKLKPAHNLIFNLQTNQINIQKYFDIENEIMLAKNISLDQRIKEISTLISDAIERRLISDVPVGSFLSGGIDSSLISAVIAKKHSNFNTFSIGFKEKSFDELPYSKIVADYIKTNHHYEYLNIDEELIKKLTENLDEPFGDSSMIPTYLLSKITKEKATVSLSGDAGDEVFGGYDTYLAHKYSQYFPNALVKTGTRLTKLFSPSDKKVSLSFKMKRFFQNYHTNANRRHLNWMATFTETEREKLLYNFLSDETILPVSKISNNFTSIQLNDIHNYLSEDILKKVDFASMQASLETRVPFLDHRLVPLVLSLPDKYKINGFTTKWLLKKIASNYIPTEIINRKKRGFTVPVSKWIKESKFIKQVISDNDYYSHQLIHQNYVLDLLKNHIDEKADNARQLWLVFVFNYWYKINF